MHKFYLKIILSILQTQIAIICAYGNLYLGVNLKSENFQVGISANNLTGILGLFYATAFLPCFYITLIVYF